MKLKGKPSIFLPAELPLQSLILVNLFAQFEMYAPGLSTYETIAHHFKIIINPRVSHNWTASMKACLICFTTNESLCITVCGYKVAM